MEFKLYENSDVLITEDSLNTKNSWHFNSDNSMDNNDEYFGWNSLKIDEEKFDSSSEKVEIRKRKLSPSAEENKAKRINNYKLDKDPLAIEEKSDHMKKASTEKGSTRMPNWQVDDYGDINGDIDSSLSLGSDLANNSYNVGDSILTINGLTVFKQEIPSPNSNEMTNLQVGTRQNRQSPTSTQGPVANNVACTMEENSQNMFNNTINQLLSQTGLVNLQNVMDNNLSSPNSQDNYNVSSTNYNYVEDCRFQYVLAAATSIATKLNEDTLTYLNQGQSYEIKLKKLGDLSMYRGKMLKSVIRICFHERRLQYMEKEQMTLWQKARPGDRILEADVPLSYGTYDIVQPNNALNIIHFTWDPTKEVGVYIKVNCISTEFTPKKHGGEKGVPFRIQVETYQNGDVLDNGKRLHAAACQIKVFKLKGADRKHKQDREKIMKRPITEQEKYQPSYECTVLNDIPSEAVLSTPPIAPIAPIMENNPPQTQPVVQQRKIENSQVNRNDIPKKLSPNNCFAKNTNTEAVNEVEQLSLSSTPDETIQWLKNNRFENYSQDFTNFSGSDMFRMSRDDFIQICGHADGIRLFNVLHSKTITPKLKIYVCKEKSTVFNAIFLSSYCNEELVKKLSTLVGISENRVRDIYMEGPQSIHVHLNNDLLKHIKEDTMFMVEIIQDSDEYYVLLLKRAINS